MVKDFPKVGYTEFNPSSYLELSKISGIKLPSYLECVNTKKKFISWNTYSYVNEKYANVYTCNSSSREYFNYKELFNIKNIIEVW